MVNEAINNEVEIVEFSLGDNFYGIDVREVKEIIRADIDFVHVHNLHNTIEGVINLRGIILPVVNLSRLLNMQVEFDRQNTRIIIVEFEKQLTGFLVSSVNIIQKIQKDLMEKPSQIITAQDKNTKAVIKFNDKIVFLIDFQGIIKNLINCKMKEEI